MKNIFKSPIILITILYIFTIMFISFIHDRFFENNFYFKDQEISVIGTVDDEPLIKENSVSFLLKTRYIKKRDKYENASAKIQIFLFVRKIKLSYGDFVQASGIFSSGGEKSNPFEFDYQDYLDKKGICGTMRIFNENKIKILSKNKGNIIVSSSLKIKNRISEIFESSIKKPYSVLLGSMIFGAKAFPIPEEIKKRYQKSGVMHILVASGQQVSILIGVCMAIGRFINCRRIFIFLFSSFITWLFVIMAGSGLSIVRAAIMGQVMVLGYLFDRENDFYNSLALSVLVILLINPNNLFDIGFQLSILATWSLVYIAPQISNLLPSYLPRYLAQIAAVAAAPVLITAPISIYYFSSFTYAAIFANMIIVPLAEFVTIFGFVYTVFGLISIYFAKLFALFIFSAVFILDKIVFCFSILPGALKYIVRPHYIFIVIYFILIIYAVEKIKKGEFVGMFRANRKYLAFLCFLVIFLNLFSSLFAQKLFTLTFLDVGQGDSIFLEMPNGKNILVDGGKKNNILLPFLHKKGVNKVDMVILTHPHEDHVGGLLQVLEDIKVDEVLDSGQDCSSLSYRRFLALIEKNKIKYNIARQGQELNFGEVKGYILAPFYDFICGTSSDLNNNSVVARFIYNDTELLLSGDAGIEEESTIISSGAEIQSDILKIGHHGSATSSSDEFLDKVSPRAAIISVGSGNRYRHPHSKTLKRLADRLIKIFRTDQDGAIVFKSNGREIEVETVK